jgi:hypothetical protein
MKYLVFGIISLLFFCKLDAQPQERIPIENSLMKAIDWYIDYTTKYLNEIADENNQITSNGIVAIEFLSQRDTIRVVRDNENQIIQVSYPRTYTFRITMFSEITARSPLPSYYFIRGKTPVIVFTGIEDFVKQNEEGLNNYKKIILSKAKGFRLISSIKAYLIEITDSNPDEFKVREVPNTIRRYYPK